MSGFRSILRTALIAVLAVLPAMLAAQATHPTTMDQLGGRYLTAHGTVNALVVFAQFPDDSLDRTHPEWPVGQPPARFGTWVDSVYTDTPTPFSMTDYFDQMSLGAYRFIGKARYVVAPRTRAEYLASGATRADVHRDLFQKLDAEMDFAEFDRWDPEGEYAHVERPDGIVDMIVVIWRNVLDDIPDAAQRDTLRERMDFTWDIEDLGFGAPLAVDGGARTILFGYGMDGTTPTGSGVTLRKPPTRLPFLSVMQTSIHEVAHYLLGWNDYHAGAGFWGMLSASGIRSYATNSFERHRLGWISLISINHGDTLALAGVTLPDFISTGVALRYVLDSARGECFYVENHQRLSRWDISSQFTDERGVYVIRQDNEVDTSFPMGKGEHMRMITADGRYNWAVPRREVHPCCGSIRVPVFRKLDPNRHTGYHHCDLIAFTDPEGDTLTSADVILTEDIHGRTVLSIPRSGTGTDAFRMGFQTVFSPWSNPTSQDERREATGFGFEITDVQPTPGGDVYVLRLFSHTAALASPARMQHLRLAREESHPRLLWQPNEEPDLHSYRIARSLFPSTGLPDTANYETAVVLPAVDDTGTPVTSWRDDAVDLVGAPDMRRYYTIEAIDSSGKRSVPVTGWIGYDPASAVNEAAEPMTPPDITPNPAAGRAALSFALHRPATVAMDLLDMNGRQIAPTIRASFPAGYHTLPLDLSTVPAGVYLVRLLAGTQQHSALFIRRPD